MKSEQYNLNKKILDMGIALTKEKNYDKLLSLIISISMDITSSDAATLYMYENNALHFKIMKNNSLNINSDNPDQFLLPPVPLNDQNVCSFSAISRSLINIPDVYNCKGFDFSGPQKYDKITGYHTKSMLVVPLENHENEIIGVLQLINALDENGNIISFSSDKEHIAMSIASQAAISVSNMKYTQEVKSMLYSVVSVFTTAVDARTPYNSCHTQNVAKYIDAFINYVNMKHDKGEISIFFDEKRREQLFLATMLHDIGKLMIPLEIMNKETRLGSMLDTIINRFNYLTALFHIDFLENKITKKQWDYEKNYLIYAKEKILEINTAPYLTEENIAFVYEISQKNYPTLEGTFQPYITSSEKECLLIPKGTLTDREREIMKTHVTFTERLLQQIITNESMKNICTWASCHHEYLDGSGYPKHLTGEDIPFEARILVVADIFEALTSADRPYKKSIDKEKAFSILQYMASEGKLDKQIVDIFEDALLFENFEYGGHDGQHIFNT